MLVLSPAKQRLPRGRVARSQPWGKTRDWSSRQCTVHRTTLSLLSVYHDSNINQKLKNLFSHIFVYNLGNERRSDVRESEIPGYVTCGIYDARVNWSALYFRQRHVVFSNKTKEINFLRGKQNSRLNRSSRSIL